MGDIISQLLNFVLASGLIGTFIFYRSRARKAQAEATHSEHSAESLAIQNLKDSSKEWRELAEKAEKTLAQKDEHIDRLYRERSTEREKLLALIRERADLQIALKSAQIKTCTIRGCDRREPPNEFY